MTMDLTIRWTLLRRTAFWLLLFTWIWAPLVHAEDPPSLAGEYVCKGESEGKPYTFVLAIQLHGESLHLQWIDGSEVVYKGLGIVQDGYLAALSMSQKGGLATVIYKIVPNGLEGSWTNGGPERFPEVCQKRRGNL